MTGWTELAAMAATGQSQRLRSMSVNPILKERNISPSDLRAVYSPESS